MSDSSDIPRLSITNLAVQAGGVSLLRDVSLTLHAGQRLALVGPSGCGKTTFLRCLTGLDEPSAGGVELDGQTGEVMGFPQLRRRMVLLDQRPTLFDESVVANLRHPFSYAAAECDFPEDRARALLDRLGLGAGRWEQDALSLSVGQQQRLCLIRALLVEPAVLLLDEPTSALDPESIDTVEQLIEESCHQRGLSALIVSHDRAQASRWCHDIVDLSPFVVAPSELGGCP
jgi:ABC-type iron transport system FetAB ATPase subunit